MALALAGCGESPPKEPTGAAAQKPASGSVDRSQAGTAAPAVMFEDGSGEPASLADFRGRPLLVNLWATWCAPCVAEMPTLNALAAREKGIEVLALSQDIEGRAKVEAFLEDRKLSNLEAHIDAELAIMGALKVSTLPTTILFDAQGRELWRMTGAEDWAGERAATLIAEAKPASRAAVR